MSSGRSIAVEALVITEREKAYSNLAINDMLKDSGLDKRERALASALYFGVLERKLTLDFYIGQFVLQKKGRIHSFTRQVLRTGIYQIAYMDKIPNSAAVNECVKIMKNSKRHSETGFVNAVLRRACKGLPELPDDIGIKYSAPDWLIKSLCKDYGKETAEKILCESLNTPPVNIRVNTEKITCDQLIEEFKSYNIIACKTDIDGCLQLKNYYGAANDELYNKGYFFFQDMASQILIKSIGIKETDRVLDLCAAPGGKSFCAAQYTNGEIIACDLYDHRAELIKKSSKRLGLCNIKTIVSDAKEYSNELGLFDIVLCDVPCSGLGVIRRKPDIKYKDTNEFSALEKTQYEILTNAKNYVKAGGMLIYSTCTLRKSENDGIIKGFLMQNPDFSLVEPTVTLFPHINGTDGFFIAKIIKK